MAFLYYCFYFTHFFATEKTMERSNLRILTVVVIIFFLGFLVGWMVDCLDLMLYASLAIYLPVCFVVNW